MEYTSSPKPQLSSRANAFSIAALMSSGKSSKDKEAEENTIKPLGKRGRNPALLFEKLFVEENNYSVRFYTMKHQNVRKVGAFIFL